MREHAVTGFADGAVRGGFSTATRARTRGIEWTAGQSF